MFRMIIFSLLLVSSSYAKYSLLSPAVPNPLQQLNNVVDQRSNQVVNKISSIKTGVVQQIENQITSKKENNERLKRISTIDYMVNKEFLFLVGKLNKLKDVSIDSRNVNTFDNSISIDKFKKGE